MARFALGLVAIVFLQSSLIYPTESRTVRQVFSKVKEKGERAITFITTPVQKVVIGNLLENCDSLKKVLGVTYEKLSERKDAVNEAEIQLDIWYGDQKTTYDINDAAGRARAAKGLQKNLPIAIFLHGFLSSSESEAALDVTRALVARGGLNVLAVDASDFIDKYYVRSSTCVRFIGEDLAKLFTEFVRNGYAPKDIHVIGHSLGSHIAGFAGKTFFDLTGSKLGRITGLDPAGPCFFKEQSDLRLKSSDADFVDVIHTDGGILGITDPIGDIDFYPNGGEKQPGCAVTPCSHSLSWKIFSESVIAPSIFKAVRCRGWDEFRLGSCSDGDVVTMGYGATPKSKGRFYLRTEGDSPYGIGMEGTKTDSKRAIIKKVVDKFF